MPRPDRMRIATLNTWKNEGDLSARLAAMAAGLRVLAPDVLLLQEVFRTADGAADTGRDLAAALGLALAYAPARAIDCLFSLGAPVPPAAHGLALHVADPDGVWPSDHAAVWADLDLPASLSA